MKITKRFHRIAPIMAVFGVLLLSTVKVAVASDKNKENSQDVEYEAGFYYTIKKGDTLWDISQHFSDSPWQWPDLWRENDQIPNPHWIYPGERIRLFRKSDKDRYAPVEKETPVPAPPIETPPTKPEVYYYYSEIDRVGFIRKPPVHASGIIFKVLDDKDMISTDDLVYVHNSKAEDVSALAAGSRWTVYRTLAPTDERKSEETIGTQHYLLGIIEITQNETQYAIGKVIKSYQYMRVGDLLMPYKAHTPEITVTDSTPGVLGKIINSEEHTDMIGERVVAFIDKGEDDNIFPGQLYNIYYQESVSIGKNGTKIDLKPVDIGSLIVLHTEKTTSTVLITDAKQKISANTKIRTP